MKVTLLDYTQKGDELAAIAAAVCYNAKPSEKALRHTIASGHESVIEHVNFTFKIEDVSRTLLAQLTRHRIASFSVQSQRYCDMSEMPVVVPESIKKNKEMLNRFGIVLDAIKTVYQEAVKAGIPKEDARFILPNAVMTTIVFTANARELRHFFSLRCCNRAQWEIRELADKMLAICKEKCPVIFENAGPGCVRNDCPEEKPCGKPRYNEELFIPF